ncbi:hypothetical protein FRC12_009618 [Ceratobasidium sp. 428]|nr:hypothetical protein FRC12_009618 [Ceratobasidium sp. 428]
MADPQDRCMADLFEMELQRKAELDPGNEWELVWFLGLPLETRCSYMRILEAPIDQDSKRQSLFRQSCYHQRSWRHPTTACMHLDVAQAPSYPWNSLNRRRRRRPTQYRRRKRRPLQPGSSQHNAPPSETHPTPMVFDPVPTRPPTPEGLRLAIHEHTDISLQAQGYDPFTGDKLCSYTPRILAVPPEPVHYPPFTLYPPINPVFVDGDYIDPILAYLVAAGHYHRTPRERYTFQNAAEEIFDTDREMPGLLDRLIDASFPGGLSDVRTAVDANQYGQVVMDLLYGWMVVPECWARNEMEPPEPHFHKRPECSCGRVE